MTNTIAIITVISTNWLSTCTEGPNAKAVDIGILSSNRYAQAVCEGVTNKFLITSELHLPKKLLIRDHVSVGGYTNFWFGRTNFPIKIIPL